MKTFWEKLGYFAHDKRENCANHKIQAIPKFFSCIQDFAYKRYCKYL